MSKRTLRAKHTERSRKRRERETRDAIAKLKARPDPVVVNGKPDYPVLHQIVRDENGEFWKRNKFHTDWERFVDESNIINIIQNYYGGGNIGGRIPIVEFLPPIPESEDYAELVWYEGQLWGSAFGSLRWYPTMRYTESNGAPA